MTYRLILTLLLLCHMLAGQQLNFSSFSSQADIHINDDGQQFIYNIGEPLNTIVTDGEGIIMQGLLNADYQTFSDERAMVQIRVFLDSNENGEKDFDEIYIVMGKVQVIDQELYQITSEDGISYLALPGTYAFNFFSLPRGFISTADQTKEITIEEGDVYQSINFGVSPDEVIEEADIYLSSGAFRCFREIDYMLCFRNKGTLTLESTIYLQIDNRLDSIFFPEQPDIIIDDHTVGWNFTLEPGRNRIIRYSVNAPEVDEPEDIGIVYKMQSWIDFNSGQREELCYEQELRCAYDPNDKRVFPNRPDSLALLEEEMLYSIRFQNTGNDVADDVVVVDTLDTNLDLSTFTIINSSHPDLLEVVFDRAEQNIVNFRFENIFLPDSTTNEPASNGHITYAITPKEGLPIDTEITNTAFIYFDFNPPIITNTTSSTLVDVFPPLVSTKETEEWNDLFIYPNPTQRTINLNEEADLIQIFNLDGQLLMAKEKTRRLSLATLPSATYVLRAYKNDLLITKKVILINN